MILKLLTEHHLEFLSLKVGCTGSISIVLVTRTEPFIVVNICYSPTGPCL